MWMNVCKTVFVCFFPNNSHYVSNTTVCWNALLSLQKGYFYFFFFLLPHQHFTSGLVLLKNSFVSSKLSWPWIRRIRGCRVSSCTCANHKLAGQLGDAVRLQTWWHAQFSDISQGTVSGEKKCLIWSSQAKINMKNKCKWKHFSPVMAASS